jgi:hypothetical protein
MLGMLALPVLGAGAAAAAEPRDRIAAEIVQTWYRLILELVRHTPTYSPPVASRAFGYVGVALYEVVASGGGLRSFAGQLASLTPLPAGITGCDVAVAVQAVLAETVHAYFGNTGPTGQRAMAAMQKSMAAKAADGVADAVVSASAAYGVAVAAHVLDWSRGDGGAETPNMGFPLEYRAATRPEQWVPTSVVRQQQMPLLPDWGNNRPFAMVGAADCGLPPPPAYSEEPGSPFYIEALEVYDVTRNLTDEQLKIARYWSDDPMLSPTPPGHWISIVLQIFKRDEPPLADRVDVLARLGMALSDSFIACWASKYEYDLLRPVTYIRRVIDPNFEPLLITPPFPEYPSGHSTQSGAAAAALTAVYGENFSFGDVTHEDDGIAGRPYASFWAAAEEAGISRLYGGIHFRAAIERGLDQGRCVAAHVNALVTKG